MSALCRDCAALFDDGVDRCPLCASPRLVRHPELAALSIAHLDCDAFYAAVEKRDRPELREVPVIVGGGARGVVTTCCYLARTFGVRSAMPMFKALRACPHAVVVRPDFAKYRAESRRIMAMMQALTPLVQPLSLDEAWMDLSGTERLNGGPPAASLARLQTRVETETGLTVSIGLGANKLLAKIASDLDKPRGFSVIGALDAAKVLAPKPASILPGVGPALVAKLAAVGLRTAGDLARASPSDLERRLGPGAARLPSLARGEDVRAVVADAARKSISAETTFSLDLFGLDALDAELWPLCETVARQARGGGHAGAVVLLKLKSADFVTKTRRKTLGEPTQTASTLHRVARGLLEEALREAPLRFRLIGVGLSGLQPAGEEGARLFTSAESRAVEAETAVDQLRARFGQDAVVRGRALTRRTPLKAGDVDPGA